ncbi:S-adenosyl-L-methionine-dependent methyltransferase [Ophiobolus disseminans]|uniref:S-adenosyl-L-methionine-dependent methyltransferase n=1 Tax=Ophiobolus disseminans TaxID=1469910 RepID=A0A6A7A6D1_9PLEO|nr:S-adenosyl-L-methionine-dependent methyltransferase [Ophiobolus disseminans]
MTARAQELSVSLSDNISTIQRFLETNKLPSLSIEQDVPFQYQANPDFTRPRDAAVLACKELLSLLTGAFGTLTSQTTAENANTQAICRFKIAESFPDKQESATFDEIADRCGLPEPEVRRIIRASLPSYIFREKSRGTVTHTAASRLLATFPLMRQWIETTGAEIHPAALKVADAIEKWPGSEEPNHTGYNIANNTTDNAFIHMSKQPGRAEKFAAAMTLFSNGPGYAPTHLVDNYPWDRHSSGTIVDVGGSHGEYSIPIAQKFSSIQRVIVQDLPHVIEQAGATAPADLQDRVTFMAHDFFQPQPVKGADVYLLRWILHDWPDTYATRILCGLVPALEKSSKVVIHEYIVPEPGQTPTVQDQTLRIFDTSMRALTNGKEREARDWKKLFAEADDRFKIEEMWTPERSSLGIIVVGWDASAV